MNLKLSSTFANWQGTDRIRYDVHIEDIGTTTVEDVTITDTYPAAMTLTNYWLDYWESWSGSPTTSNPLTVTLGRLEPGWTVWLHMDLDVPSIANGTLFTNTVEMTTPPDDVNPADNHDEVAIGSGPDLRVEKWLSGGTSQPGKLLTYTLHFRNDSEAWWTAGNVWVTDTLPASVSTCPSSSRRLGRRRPHLLNKSGGTQNGPAVLVLPASTNRLFSRWPMSGIMRHRIGSSSSD
jgi:uncharacterized repeat protein (TIGR01451 family)